MATMWKCVLGVLAILLVFSTVSSATPMCTAGSVYSYFGTTCTYGGIDFSFSNAQAISSEYNYVTKTLASTALTGVQVSPYLNGNNVGFTFSALPGASISGNNIKDYIDAWLTFTATPVSGSIVGTGAFVTNGNVSASSDDSGARGSGSALASTDFFFTSSSGVESVAGPYANSTNGSVSTGTENQNAAIACSGCTPFLGVMQFELKAESYFFNGSTYVTTGTAGGSASADSGTMYLTLSRQQQTVPEPASLLLLMSGMFPILLRRVRR